MNDSKLLLPLRRFVPWPLAALAVLALACCLSGARAQNSQTAAGSVSAGDAPAGAGALQPPEIEFDWVQLSSGEWLKGEIKALYDDQLEFDSDELGLLSLDIEDIVVIRSASRMSINVGNRRPIIGRVVADAETVTVYDGEKAVSIPRSGIVAATMENNREIGLWTAKVSLGANFRAGNTEQVEYNMRLLALRRSALSRFNFEYLGNVSATNSVQSADNHRATSFFDIFLSRRWFLRPVTASYFRDTFQGIAHRVTVGTGFGYEIVETARFEWNVFSGPGYLYVDYVNATGSDTRQAPAALFVSSFDYEINRYQDLTGTYGAAVTNANLGGYIHNLQLILENEVTDDFDIDIALIWAHTQYPAAQSDSERPERDDLRLVFSVGYEL